MRSGGGGEGIMHILYTSTKAILSGSPPLTPPALLYVPGSFGWVSYSLHILRQLKSPHDLSKQHRFLESEALGSES